MTKGSDACAGKFNMWPEQIVAITLASSGVAFVRASFSWGVWSAARARLAFPLLIVIAPLGRF
jgi:hypothetical protein